MEDAAKPVRMIVCTRCGTNCRAVVQEFGVDPSLPKWAHPGWHILGSLLAALRKDAVEPHNAPCGLLCGEPMFDGIGRHTGSVCGACALARMKYQRSGR